MSGPGRAETAPYTFDAKYPGEVVEIIIDPALLIDTDAEEVAVLSIASFPSADGELRLSHPVNGAAALSMTAEAGQPGRIYTLQVVIQTTTGDIRELVGHLSVRRVLVSDMPQALAVYEWSPPLMQRAASTWDLGATTWDLDQSIWDEIK